MSWHDRFNARGRFRQAEFVLQDDALAFGRRAQVHQYPERDRPYVEDLGRRAREFDIEVYVIGPDYDRKRDALIAAIEQPGPGTLVHPRHGTLRVSITQARKRETTRRGGLAHFSLTCVEAGEAQFPTAALDTPKAVQAQAAEARASLVADFSGVWSTDGQPEFVREAGVSVLDRATSAIEGLTDAIPGIPEPVAQFRADLGEFAGSLSSLVAQPARLAGEITRLVGDIAGIVQRPGLALQIYEGLFDHGEADQPVARTTPARQQQADNQAAVHAIVQRAAAVEAGRAASHMSWPTLAEAVADRDRIAEQLDELAATAGHAPNPQGTPTPGPAGDGRTREQGTTDPDTVYRALMDLRVAVIRDITTRGVDLDRLGAWTPPSTLPALVIAHRIYGDASRAGEIVTRNRIRHPGFVPGGRELEVRLDA